MKNMFLHFILLTGILFFALSESHAQWVQASGYGGGYVEAFAVSGTNLFAGTFYGGVFLSTNNGTSWTAVNSGLTETYVTSLAVSPNGTGGTILFAGTNGGGVFLSTDDGTSWTAVNSGLTRMYVSSLTVSPNGTGGTNLFAGTDSGVWRRPLSEMITSVEKPSTDLPTHFSLDQNYPNPFNPLTVIRYQLPVNGHATMKIFNMLGQEVATLFDGEQEAGYRSVEWNATNYASGVYFYRIDAMGQSSDKPFSDVRKMMLLR